MHQKRGPREHEELAAGLFPVILSFDLFPRFFVAVSLHDELKNTTKKSQKIAKKIGRSVGR
jgi:hypothetical protein